MPEDKSSRERPRGGRRGPRVVVVSDPAPQREAVHLLPVLPIKNTVLFPSIIMPLSVGRPMSVAAVEAAGATEEKEILVITQRDASIEEPNQDDLYTIGTRAIVKKPRQHEQVLEVIVQGVERVVLIKLERAGDHLQARVRPAPVPVETSVEIEALRREVYELASRANELSRAIRRYVAARRREERAFDWTELARRSRADPEARDILQRWRRKQAILNRSAEKLRVLEDILRLHADEPVVVFTASNRMALDVSARFLIPALTAHSDKHERNRVLDAFDAGRIRALAACQVLNEGWDAPAVKVGVVLGGEQGVREAVQRLGRRLRKQGDRSARLYEVVVQESADVERAQRRTRTDAYRGASRLSLGQASQLDLF